MNMFKTTLLMTALLTAPVTFSVLAQTEVAHVSVSAVSGTPSVVEDAIAKLAQEKKATSWIAALTQRQFCTSEESRNGKISSYIGQR